VPIPLQHNISKPSRSYTCTWKCNIKINREYREYSEEVGTFVAQDRNKWMTLVKELRAFIFVAQDRNKWMTIVKELRAFIFVAQDRNKWMTLVKKLRAFIFVAQDRNKWMTIVKKLRAFIFPYKQAISLTA
jgi:hypothetical protein